MAEGPESPTPRELARAERLDEEISRALTGAPEAGADRTVLWLAASARREAPPGLAERVLEGVRGPARRAWLAARALALALAALLVLQAAGSLFRGEWLAEQLGEPYAPHFATEGGLALLAVALAVAAGAVRRSWLTVSVLAGSPLALALGVGGVTEIGVFAAGAALHLTVGAVGLGLLIAWWRARRYGIGPPAEEEA